MPTDRKRRVQLMVPESVRVLGLDPDEAGAPQLGAALGRYSAAVARANRELQGRLKREDWCYLADVLNGCADLWDYTESPVDSTTLIVAQVEDGHALDRTGDKWYGPGKAANRRVRELAATVGSLSSVHGDAIMAAVRVFWAQPGVDPAADKWWTVEYRTAAAKLHGSG